MNRSSIARTGLQVRLLLTRFGWGNSLAFVLCIAGIVGWSWSIPRMHAQASAQQHASQQAQQVLDTAPITAPVAPLQAGEQRMQDFYDALGEKRYAEQQVRTLFAIAARNGLTLSQGEYKSAYDMNGRFHVYRIQLPVKGPYAAIRQFCEKVLLAIPFASLDEMSFKRDAIADSMPEANLRLTLYLGDAALPGDSPATGILLDLKQ